MANPYYINIDFPERSIAAGREKVTFKFKVNYEGTNITISASDYKLALLHIEPIKQEYNLREQNLANGELSLKIHDRLNILTDYLHGVDWDVFEKNFYIKYEVNSGSGFVIEFEGHVMTESIIINEKDRTIEIKAGPKTEIINSILLWDNNTPLNPLGYSTNTYIKIKDVITDIYRVVNPSIDVIFRQEWIYQAALLINDISGWYNDVTFDELYLYTNDYFFNTNFKIYSLGDLLKRLGFEFGCYTGIMNAKGYFWQLYSLDEQNVITVNTKNVISIEKTYEDVISYVRVHDRFNNIFTEGNFTGFETQKIEKDISWFIAFASPTQYYGTWRVNRGSTDRFVYAIMSPNIGGTYPAYTARYIAKYWFKVRGNLLSSKIYTIALIGTDYYIHNDYSIAGKHYHPFSIEKDFQNNKTTLKMLYI